MRLPTIPATLTRLDPRARRAQDTPDGVTHVQRFALNATATHKHLLATPQGVQAWFVLGGVDWPMQTHATRATIMTEQEFRWADLIGHRVTLLGHASPWPHQEAADALRDPRNTPAPLPDVDGAGTFEDYVTAAQEHAIRFGARRDVALLGVHLSDYRVPADKLPDLLSPTPLPPGSGELDKVRRALRAVTEAVARPGFEGRPIRASGLAWLLHASIGLGAPAPALHTTTGRDGWSADDMPGFVGPVTPVQAPLAPTTEIRALRGSREHTHHVAVLHVDAFEPRDPDRGDLAPFLAWTTTREYPVWYSAIFDVVDGRDLKSAAELDRRKAKNIAAHHEEHGDDAPARVLRSIERAREVEDEVSNGTREQACRLTGVIRLAVVGSDAEATCETAADLTVAAAREQGMTLAHDYGQFDSYRSFIPGEPSMMTGHVKRMSAEFAASGVPNATSGAGDAFGFLTGNIAGSQDMYLFDTHGGARRNKSNLVVIGAEPGAGKSTLGGALADHCTRRGIRTVVYDPSGPLAALAGLPYMAGHAQHLSLTSAHRGVLTPHLMIPDPRRQDYDATPEGKTEYQRDYAAAEAERMELCIDTFRDLLPYAMVSGDRTGEVQGAIETAVTTVGGAYGVDPWRVLDQLKNLGEVGRNIAGKLEARAALTDGALVFPDRVRGVDDEHGKRLLDRAVLTVITMEGLTLPPKDQPDRSLWSRQAQASVPILNLGARFATRIIYADRDPKAVVLDEMGIATGGAGSFASFSVRSSFDSRKFNALIALMCQNPNTLTALDSQLSNLTGAAFIGRMDEDAALNALQFLRLKEDSGYHAAIETLQTGEFMVRGWDGRVRKIVVDRDWWDPALTAALDTNPYGDDAAALAGAASLGGVL